MARALAKKAGWLKGRQTGGGPGADVDLRTGCALEIDLFALCFASPDPEGGSDRLPGKTPAGVQG